MAMGADRGLLVDTGTSESDLEPLAVAKLLKEVVKSEDRNLVILGKQSIDDDSGQTGQMLAGLLGWSQATQASKVELLDGGRVRVTKEVDGGEEVVEAALPMVITTDLRLNEPYVNPGGVMGGWESFEGDMLMGRQTLCIIAEHYEGEEEAAGEEEAERL